MLPEQLRWCHHTILLSRSRLSGRVHTGMCQHQRGRYRQRDGIHVLPDVSILMTISKDGCRYSCELLSDSELREYDYSCQTTASYDWESTLGCVMPVDSSSTTIWTVTEISSGSTSTVTSTGYYGGMNAYSIQVRFQATDLAAATTSQTVGYTHGVLFGGQG